MGLDVAETSLDDFHRLKILVQRCSRFCGMLLFLPSRDLTTLISLECIRSGHDKGWFLYWWACSLPIPPTGMIHPEWRVTSTGFQATLLVWRPLPLNNFCHADENGSIHLWLCLHQTWRLSSDKQILKWWNGSFIPSHILQHSNILSKFSCVKLAQYGAGLWIRSENCVYNLFEAFQRLAYTSTCISNRGIDLFLAELGCLPCLSLCASFSIRSERTERNISPSSNFSWALFRFAAATS